jgi:hypothetical protein
MAGAAAGCLPECLLLGVPCTQQWGLLVVRQAAERPQLASLSRVWKG